MLWEWLAWRIFPRWHQQPVKHRGSISALWPLQQSDLQGGQPGISVCTFVNVPKYVHFWLQNREWQAPCLGPALGQCSSCPCLSAREFGGWQVIPAEQEEKSFGFSSGKIVAGVRSGTEQVVVCCAKFSIKFRLSLFWWMSVQVSF